MFRILSLFSLLSVVFCNEQYGLLQNKSRDEFLTFPQKPNTRTPRLKCGTSIVDEQTGLERFPWLVAIQKQIDGSAPIFLCSGTLISDTRIVTAAHCLHNKKVENATKVEDLILVLGAFDLKNENEPGRITVTPSNVTFHQRWNASSERFTDDIAVLTLKTKIKPTDYVSKICLYREDQYNYDGEGKVVGWSPPGDDDSQTSEVYPETNFTKIKLNEDCYREFSLLAWRAWAESFCAVLAPGGCFDGTNSAGFYSKLGSRYYFRGFSSFSARSSRGCHKNSIYTDVASYSEYLGVPKLAQQPKPKVRLETIQSGDVKLF